MMVSNFSLDIFRQLKFLVLKTNIILLNNPCWLIMLIPASKFFFHSIVLPFTNVWSINMKCHIQTVFNCLKVWNVHIWLMLCYTIILLNKSLFDEFAKNIATFFFLNQFQLSKLHFVNLKQNGGKHLVFKN